MVKLPVLLASIVLFLSGCANSLSSDVVTFHDGPLPNGETIRVVPIDPDRAPSLEFRSYANLVNEELRKIGYTPVTEANVPTELLAEVDYFVEPGPPVVSDPDRYVRYHFSAGRLYDPFYLGAGRFYDPLYFGAGRFYDPLYFGAGRFYDPFYFGIYDTWGPDVQTSPTFVRNLQLNIIKNDDTRERIFEGQVQSAGYDDRLPEIMPYLVTAMFKNYPGESGVTKVVTIEKDQ